MISYWWFRPSRVALAMAMPITVYAYLASDGFYQAFGAFNAVTDNRFFLAWISILGFSAASWLGESLALGRGATVPLLMREANYRFLLFGLAAIAMGATVVFLAPFAARPDLVLRILEGEPGAADMVRAYADQIPGVTSQENLFSLVVVLFMIKPALTGLRPTMGEKWVLGLILGLTALKVLVHSERLALIELLIPLFILISASRRRSILWGLAPMIGVAALFVFFAATEYFRSWASFYAARSDDLFEFALERIVGYYVTAVNNGAYIYGHDHSFFFPVYSGAWLWRLPIPGLSDYLADLTGTRLDTMTVLSGLNVEFNNPSGIFAPLIDFGPVIGVLVWVGLGYVSGRLYRCFVDGHCLGLILFPTWYVGVLEIPRIFYWGDSRYFPPLIVSLAIAAVFLFMLPRTARTPYRRVRRGSVPTGTNGVPGGRI